MKETCKTCKGKGFILITAIVVVALVAVFAFAKKPYKKVSATEATYKTESFVNNYLMPTGSKAKVLKTETEYDLYKLTLDIGSGAPVESYVSKDGKFFFPQAINMDEDLSLITDNDLGGATIPENLPKSSRPSIELFVMSYCPYGTQIEKGIIPVLELLGNKVDFELKFVDYAMHDKIELDENLVQYCIQKEEPEKLLTYLSCFLDDGDRDGCLASTIANKAAIDNCVAATDKEFKVSEDFENRVNWRGSFPGFAVDSADNQKYGVAGSPTLIINGMEVQSARDSASLLNTICAAFEDAPEECASELNQLSPTPGFGFNFSANAGSMAAACY